MQLSKEEKIIRMMRYFSQCLPRTMSSKFYKITLIKEQSKRFKFLTQGKIIFKNIIILLGWSQIEIHETENEH